MPLPTPHARNGHGWAGVLGAWPPFGNMADLQARSEPRTTLGRWYIGILMTTYNIHTHTRHIGLWIRRVLFPLWRCVIVEVEKGQRPTLPLFMGMRPGLARACCANNPKVCAVPRLVPVLSVSES